MDNITRQPEGNYGTYIVINPRPPAPKPSAGDKFVMVAFLIAAAVWLVKYLWNLKKEKEISKSSDTPKDA